MNIAALPSTHNESRKPLPINGFNAVFGVYTDFDVRFAVPIAIDPLWPACEWLREKKLAVFAAKLVFFALVIRLQRVAAHLRAVGANKTNAFGQFFVTVRQTLRKRLTSRRCPR